MKNPRHDPPGPSPTVSANELPSAGVRRALGVALLVLAVAAAYWNSLHVPFFFDDNPGIVDNPSIRSLRHFWDGDRPAPLAGSAVVGRPVVNFTLALNYAAGGTSVVGYHAVNVAIHLGAALLLCGIVRRTLRRAVLPDWLRTQADAVALGVAAVWALHPLQTESVTFVIQRTESLAGLVYLAALYAFVRGVDPSPPRHALGLSLALVWLGMATKETTATLPLILLLYDRTFVSGSFAAAWRARARFYAGVALAWLLLAWFMFQTHARNGTVTLEREVTAWMSLLTQSRAVVMYLSLAFWPHPLVMDYGDYLTETITRLGEVWPQMLLLVALGGLTVLALVRRPLWGFLGAWFFIVLAPSSSFVPLLSQMRAEHRMYLPLAAIVTGATIAIWRYAGRLAPGVVAVWALALAGTTVARNRDYRSPIAIWSDTIAKHPSNPRAHENLGVQLELAGDGAAAEREYRTAVLLQPSYVEVHLALAARLFERGETEEAKAHLATAIECGPATSNEFNNLGKVQLMIGQIDPAIASFRSALKLDASNHEAHNNLGYCLAQQGQIAEALEHFGRAVELKPTAIGELNLGETLLKAGRKEEAIAALRESVRLQPDLADAGFSLANALVGAGRYGEARANYEHVVQLQPTHVGAWFNLGQVCRQTGQLEAARAAFREVLKLEPSNAAAARQLAALGP